MLARAHLPIALAALALTTCQSVVGVGAPCAADADCEGGVCVDGFCTVVVEGEGEGDAGEGEGEGEILGGEGEGEVGEGEGEAGEGEGEAGEGEGEAGEGEGEPPPPPRTCLELKLADPAAPSGNYALDLDGDGALDDRNGDGAVNGLDEVPCEMTIDGGGWTLAGAINEAIVRANGCPGNMQLIETADFIGCRRGPQGTGGQVSANVAPLIAWRSVIGKARGVAFADHDGFAPSGDVDENNINDEYVDGVSVTTAGARAHIWTFTSGHPLQQTAALCPCEDPGAGQPPAFVGDNYFCDRPSTAAVQPARAFDPSTPQWDGSNVCQPDDALSNAALPFFIRKDFFAVPTQQDIEVRIMADQNTDDEDVVITDLQIFVRE